MSSKTPYIVGGSLALAGLAYYLYSKSKATALASGSAPTGSQGQLQSGPQGQLQAGSQGQLQAGSQGQLQAGSQGQLQAGSQGQLQAGSPAPIVLDLAGKTLTPSSGAMKLQTPYRGPPTPGAYMAQRQGTPPADAASLLYQASMSGKRIIATYSRGGSSGQGGYEHETFFKIADPAEAVPIGWFSFLEPGSADSVYRSAGVDPSTLRNAGAIPPTLPFSMARDQTMLNHTADQVAFVEGLVGRDADIVEGDIVAVRVLDPGKAGGYRALDLLLAATSVYPFQSVYVRDVPGSERFLTLVAPDAMPKDASYRLLFAPNQLPAAVFDSKADTSKMQSVVLPASLIPAAPEMPRLTTAAAPPLAVATAPASVGGRRF